MRKRTFRRIAWLLLAILISFVTIFAWPRLPIITAFAAKGMCSSIFLAGKDPTSVMSEDLSFFPISLARCDIDYNERSVTARVLGIAKRKAVFRDGLGAVLVLAKDEKTLRSESLDIPSASYDQDTLAWPMGDLLTDTIPVGVNMNRIKTLVDTSIDNSLDEPYKKTLGLAIVYKGQLIAEKYFNSYDEKTKFHGWSMTKSITGAYAGSLYDRGLLTLSSKTGIEEWQEDERADICLEDVMRMSTGLDWFENYFTISDATIMLMQSDDMLKAVKTCELAAEPGTVWNYSSGDANLLSGMIRNTLNDDETYHKGLYTQLFHKIGMLNTVVETDASGLFVASSYSYGTVRDWARFGLLFLNNGVFEGDTVLSKEWVDFMKAEAPASSGEYAGTFWLKESEERALVDVPEDIFFADGFLGQRVYIIPSKELVVVRMGYSLSNFNVNDFLRELISALES